MRLKPVFVSPVLHGKVRVFAAQRGVSITGVVTAALENWMADQVETKPKKNGKR